ncbi:unnamed protein product [Pleuronectes platessa]|uniref:Uncharacterized protein n=1 Tax=Pleuronectes platessa TaxID=8262 RepID=A0A9N7UNR2_PLEPL|nr:unnamed protein product [Pleuronectes platessa]
MEDASPPPPTVQKMKPKYPGYERCHLVRWECVRWRSGRGAVVARLNESDRGRALRERPLEVDGSRGEWTPLELLSAPHTLRTETAAHSLVVVSFDRAVARFAVQRWIHPQIFSATPLPRFTHSLPLSAPRTSPESIPSPVQVALLLPSDRPASPSSTTTISQGEHPGGVEHISTQDTLKAEIWRKVEETGTHRWSRGVKEERKGSWRERRACWR